MWNTRGNIYNIAFKIFFFFFFNECDIIKNEGHKWSVKMFNVLITH